MTVLFDMCFDKKCKTEAKWVGPSPSTAPAHKSTRGDTEVKTGTGRRNIVEPGRETSLEPLRHTLFGEYIENQDCLLKVLFLGMSGKWF